MAAYRYAVIGVLIVTHSVLSHDMNCTSVTMTCPTAKQWTERGKNFSCTGKKQYICLLASNWELREGCIFNSTIPAGQIGCPNTNHCDDLTGQPLIVTRKNYLPCPPEHNGCPPRNHSGYSILQIYKYPACQGRYISGESSFFADEVTTPARINLPLGVPRYENWKIMIICIAIGILLIIINCVYLWIKYEVADPPEDQQILLIARHSLRLSSDLTIEPITRDFDLGSDQQIVSEHKDLGYLQSYRRNSSSSDSEESESPMLERSSNSICEQPSGHIYISSSQEGPPNPCQELSYTDPMFAKGTTQENDKNMEELQRRLDASVKENNYLKNKIKYLEKKISGLSVDLNADIHVEGSQESDLSTRLHM